MLLAVVSFGGLVWAATDLWPTRCGMRHAGGPAAPGPLIELLAARLE